MRKATAWAAAVMVVVMMATGCSRTADNDAEVLDRPESTTTAARRSTTTTTSTTASTTTTTTVAPTTTLPPSPPPPPPPGVRVTNIVDGDTLDVASGERVRLIGIDTPERGECGYSEAADLLGWLVAGKSVILVAGARDDTDRYGRLLRYVELDGSDINLEMIRSGRAIARYDSRDGYGRHPRQDTYIQAQAARVPANGCSAQPPPPPVPSSGGSGTDPRFGTCKEAKANGYGPYVRGIDSEYTWYRDADSDGIVCE
jgi:endonuclease YncB( thermonuclease family)